MSVERPGIAPLAWRREASAGLLCLVCGLAFLPTYRLAGLNSDATVYMRIAAHYLNGRWDEAINAYWSPLFSWLIAPVMGVGLDGPTALRFVCLLTAAGTLLVFRALARQLGVTASLIDIASLGVVPYLYVFCLTGALGLSPDVLLACFVLLYLKTLWRRPRTLGGACAAGFVAGIGYLAKAYALPFFLAHFTATMAAEAWRVRSRFGVGGPLARWAAGVVCFALVAAPWAAVISRHHGQLTFATTGAFNLSFMNPAAQNPIYTDGLIPPPGPNGMSSWENPAALPMADWRWWRSPEDFAIGLRAMLRSVIETLKHLADLSGVAFALGITGAASLLAVRGLRRRRVEIRSAFFAAAVYTSGYVMTARWVELRYLIPVSLLMTLCAMVWAEEERRRGSGRRVALPLVAAIALGYAMPASYILLKQRSQGLQPRVVATSLAEIVEPRHRIASKDDWKNSVLLTYWLDAKYYGTPRPGDLARQLSEHEIDFLLVWQPTDHDSELPGRRLDPKWAGPPAVYDLRN